MDCCICSPMAAVFRPPRNTICVSCYEAAKGMAALLDGREKIGQGDVAATTNSRPAAGNNHHRPSHPPKSLADALRWMQAAKAAEDGLQERLGFLESFSTAFRDGLHADILVKPGTGPPIPAHRALLASKSEILRTMLGGSDEEGDACKAPAGSAITLSDLTHPLLHALLTFLYSATLPDPVADEHAHALLLAADKYDIPALRRFCERRLLASLSSFNALDALETADACSDAAALREEAMATIARAAEAVVFSGRYEAFAAKNAHMCVEITRMLIRQMVGGSRDGDIKDGSKEEQQQAFRKAAVMGSPEQLQGSQGL